MYFESVNPKSIFQTCKSNFFIPNLLIRGSFSASKPEGFFSWQARRLLGTSEQKIDHFLHAWVRFDEAVSAEIYR
jgi:hypothetical protein